jgi:hypothetical protein
VNYKIYSASSGNNSPIPIQSFIKIRTVDGLRITEVAENDRLNKIIFLSLLLLEFTRKNTNASFYSYTYNNLSITV